MKLVNVLGIEIFVFQVLCISLLAKNKSKGVRVTSRVLGMGTCPPHRGRGGGGEGGQGSDGRGLTLKSLQNLEGTQISMECE